MKPRTSRFAITWSLLFVGLGASPGLWAQELKPLPVLKGHTRVVLSVVFSPDGKTVASGSTDRSVKLWDIATGKCIRSFKANDAVRRLAFSPDGKTLAGLVMNSVRLWDLATGTETANLDMTKDGGIECVAFSPDGKLLVAAGLRRVAGYGTHGVAVLWDVSAGKVLTKIRPMRWVKCARFSEDGKTLVLGDTIDGFASFETATGKNISFYRAGVTELGDGAISHDGTVLAAPRIAGGGNAIQLWDVATGKKGLSLSGSLVGFTHDGKRLVTRSRDKTVMVWELATGRKLTSFKGPESAILAMNLEGNVVAARGKDDTITLWRLPQTK